MTTIKIYLCRVRAKMTANSYSKNISETKQLQTGKKCSIIIVICWTIIVILMELILLKLSAPKTLSKFSKLTESTDFHQNYTSPSCLIPNMDPYDPSIKKFIFKPKKIMCKSKVPPLFESNLTSLFLIKEYLPHYKISNIADLHCCYREFWRKKPIRGEEDKQFTYSKKCIPLTHSALCIKQEFVKVTCKNNEYKTIYEDFFIFVPLKREHLRGTSSKQKPNILVLGLDGVSRMNFHRQLPKTCEYLTRELESVELLGYNKVADNTFPNLIPVLTGMRESELKKICWPYSTSRFDDCEFLWNKFNKNNYVTAFGEDCAYLGLFHFERQGFMSQPTDYYYSYFNVEMETLPGGQNDLNCAQCHGGRLAYKGIIDYIQKFIAKMKLESIPYFGFFFSSSLSHDFLNLPALGDKDYYNLLSNLKNNGYLKNTILIFMSDHGMRIGGIRRTYQGQMEDRLPFVFIVLPNWFKEEYPNAVRNLNENARRLTTPFDIHETLKDLLNIKNLQNIEKPLSGDPQSLFKEIPIERTCWDAKIESHWCSCHRSIQIPTNNSLVVSAAIFAVNDMNSQLDGYAQCATLVLDGILNAGVISYDSKHFLDTKRFQDYIITFKTVPGNGLFEATVRFKATQDQILAARNRKPSLLTPVDQWTNFSITGTISRVNLYGNQSYCIKDFRLKLYCYCKSLINT